MENSKAYKFGQFLGVLVIIGLVWALIAGKLGVIIIAAIIAGLFGAILKVASWGLKP